MTTELAPQPAATRARVTRVDRWSLLTGTGIVVYLAFSLLFLVRGQFNTDEGWYLYASRLVMHGQLPYRDFAFTQMPLMPYVYGLPEALFGPSLMLGRLTSLGFSLATLVLGIVAARRYAGAAGGALASLLLAVFAYEIYYNTLIKTYALVSFCFMTTLVVLSSRRRDEVRYPLAALLAIAAAATRLSAVAFAVPLVLYCLAAPRCRPALTRALVLLVSLLALVPVLLLIGTRPRAAYWHLVGDHVARWGDATTRQKVVTIALSRIPGAAEFFGIFLALALITGYVALRQRSIRAYLRQNEPLVVVAAGLVLFVGSHVPSGGWHYEYFVPAITVFLPLIAIVLARLWGEQELAGAGGGLITGLLIAVVVLAPLTQVVEQIDRSGPPPLAEIDTVAAFLRRNTGPNDQVLALEALSVAVEANRPVLPGLSLAHFSYEDVSDARAHELNVVNADILADDIRNQRPAAIILTPRDWNMFTRAGVYSTRPADVDVIRTAFDGHYQEAFKLDDFGQFNQPVYVYLRQGVPVR